MVKRGDMLYYVVLIGLMFLLPVGFAWYYSSHWIFEFKPSFEFIFFNVWVPDLAESFVFFAVGQRLILEGFRRFIWPRASAFALVRLVVDGAEIRVRLVGFALVILGCTGIFLLHENLLAASIFGSFFCFFSGFAQLLRKRIGGREHLAMLCELICGMILFVLWFIQVSPVTSDA